MGLEKGDEFSLSLKVKGGKPKKGIKVTFEAGIDEMIIVKGPKNDKALGAESMRRFDGSSMVGPVPGDRSSSYYSLNPMKFDFQIPRNSNRESGASSSSMSGISRQVQGLDGKNARPQVAKSCTFLGVINGQNNGLLDLLGSQNKNLSLELPNGAVDRTAQLVEVLDVAEKQATVRVRVPTTTNAENRESFAKMDISGVTTSTGGDAFHTIVLTVPV